MSPTCPYCGKGSQLLFVNAPGYPYGHRDYGPVYVCVPCKAWVCCHAFTIRPLGRLADAALRKAKMQAHEVFDFMWQKRARLSAIPPSEARRAGYAWLAKQLNLPIEQCHIGMMDLEACRRVCSICSPYTRKNK